MEKEYYKSFDELPIMLSVNQLANVLGISRTSSYDLARSKGFPSITIGSRIVVPIDISKEDAIELAKKDEKIAAEIAGKEIKKEIYVPGKLVNIVAI